MTALLSSSSRAPLDNDDVEPLGLSLLELEEEETTDHVIGDLTITLRGYPRSSGQTLQCTGETTWRGGDLLARHLYQCRAKTSGRGLGAGHPLPSARIDTLGSSNFFTAFVVPISLR